MKDPFRYFNSSAEVIRLTVLLYIRYPLSLRQVEDILFERGIDICHETVRLWWNRFGPMFASETLIRGRSAAARTTLFAIILPLPLHPFLLPLLLPVVNPLDRSIFRSVGRQNRQQRAGYRNR